MIMGSSIIETELTRSQTDATSLAALAAVAMWSPVIVAWCSAIEAPLEKAILTCMYANMPANIAMTIST